MKDSDIENLGAEFYNRINHGKNNEYIINSDTLIKKITTLSVIFFTG